MGSQSTKVRKMGEVETYTSLAPVGAVTQGYRGLLVVSKVKSRNVFSDIGSGLKSMVGGEIKGLSKLTSDVREELLVEIKKLPRWERTLWLESGWRRTPSLTDVLTLSSTAPLSGSHVKTGQWLKDKTSTLYLFLPRSIKNK